MDGNVKMSEVRQVPFVLFWSCCWRHGRKIIKTSLSCFLVQREKCCPFPYNRQEVGKWPFELVREFLKVLPITSTGVRSARAGYRCKQWRCFYLLVTFTDRYCLTSIKLRHIFCCREQQDVWCCTDLFPLYFQKHGKNWLNRQSCSVFSNKLESISFFVCVTK